MNKKQKLHSKWANVNTFSLCVGSLSIVDLRNIIISSDDANLKKRCLDMLGVLSEFIHECRPYLQHGDYSLAVCIKGVKDSS